MASSRESGSGGGRGPVEPGIPGESIPGEFRDGTQLPRRIMEVMHQRDPGECVFPRRVSRSVSSSAVLFLLAFRRDGRDPGITPCVVLNKRSRWVRQPGDLCFPGGSVSPRLDAHLGRILQWPFFPLARWPYWPDWRRTRPRESRRLALLLATSIRESLEEMRLNPLDIRFLGPMPSQDLPMFNRVLYPMVGWINRQRRFFPNWEVERVLYVPLRELLDPGRYARYRLRFDARPDDPRHGTVQDFSCFLHRGKRGEEILWGATYRIVMGFLAIVFGFRPPPLEGLPVVSGVLDGDYLYGPPRRDRDS